MKAAAFFSAFLLVLAQPATAQSIFDGLGGTGDPARDAASAEYEQWKRTIARQAKEHTSRLWLGHGSVTVHFCVDAAGRVADANVVKASNNEQALLALSTISSLKLPPPPASARKAAGGKCHLFSQSFFYP
ncbi:energy transducer TonB [Methylosinus sp. LW4]|uniref:energy transducer TonB n=1 Tax=Methylosinus sp. LW4 TaxID=136993 RepID=UPI000361DE14|nr:energy transducer TonB [Methylosinus sp. LW4]